MDLEITMQGNGARYRHPNDAATAAAGGTSALLETDWAMQVCKFAISSTPTTV